MLRANETYRQLPGWCGVLPGHRPGHCQQHAAQGWRQGTFPPLHHLQRSVTEELLSSGQCRWYQVGRLQHSRLGNPYNGEPQMEGWGRSSQNQKAELRLGKYLLISWETQPQAAHNRAWHF